MVRDAYDQAPFVSGQPPKWIEVHYSSRCHLTEKDPTLPLQVSLVHQCPRHRLKYIGPKCPRHLQLRFSFHRHFRMQYRVNDLQTFSGLSVCLAGLVYHAAVFAKAAQRRDVTTLLKARCIIYLVTSTPAVALLALLTNDDAEMSNYILLNILRLGNALCTSAASVSTAPCLNCVWC